MTGVIVLDCEPRVPSWMGRDTSCKSEYSSRVNIQIHFEAFLQRYQVFALGLERSHITAFVLALPLCHP